MQVATAKKSDIINSALRIGVSIKKIVLESTKLM